MKNSQKGFIGLVITIIIGLVLIGGGTYVYLNKGTTKSENQSDSSKKSNTFVVDATKNPFTLISGDNVFLAKDTDGSFTTLQQSLIEGGKTTTSTTLKVREENVMKKFYMYYPDSYDFVVIFSTFYNPNDADYGNVVYNPTKGIGIDKVYYLNNLATYGSGEKLKHITVMHYLSRFENSSANLTHEIGHYWLMYISDPDLTISRNGDGHWSNFMDTATKENGVVHLSPMSGYPLKDNGNGTFSVDDIMPRSYNKFNSMELYLMGLLPASETKPLTLWKTNASQVSGTMTGSKKIITVDDLIKIAGPRVPAYPDTQRDFKIAYILLPKQGEMVDPLYIKNIKWIAENFPSEWSSATGGLSKLK